MVWEIYSILIGKPTRKVAFKRCVNRWAYLLLGFAMPFNILMVLILASAGNEMLKETTTSVDVITITSGISLMFDIVLFSFVVIVVMDALNVAVRKKKLQVINIYFNWTEKLDKEGFLKYTDEEKEYNKAQDIKSKEQLRRWFPFIKKFDKKVV